MPMLVRLSFVFDLWLSLKVTTIAGCTSYHQFVKTALGRQKLVSSHVMLRFRIVDQSSIRLLLITKLNMYNWNYVDCTSFSTVGSARLFLFACVAMVTITTDTTSSLVNFTIRKLLRHPSVSWDYGVAPTCPGGLEQRRLSWSVLQGYKAWVVFMEKKLLPMQQILPLHVVEMIYWKGRSQYTWFQRRCRSCQKVAEISSELPSGLQLRICPQGLLSKPFLRSGMTTRQWRFKIRVFLPLDGVPTKVDEPHLPGAAGFKAPATLAKVLS